MAGAILRVHQAHVSWQAQYFVDLITKTPKTAYNDVKHRFSVFRFKILVFSEARNTW